MNKNMLMYESMLRSDNRSECTISAYLSDINLAMKFFDKDEKDITYFDCIEWKNSISNLAPNTINRKIIALSRYFQFLVNAEVITTNHFAKLEMLTPKNVRQRDYIPMESAKRLLLAAKNNRDRAIIATLLTFGLRVNEVINLGLKDYLKGEAMVITKGGKIRHIVYTDDLKKYINMYLKDRKNSGIPNLFVSNSGKPMIEQCINDMLKLTARHANLTENITPHSMRHTHISYMVDNYGISAAQHEIGHSSVAITSRYAHNTDDQLVSMVRSIAI